MSDALTERRRLGKFRIHVVRKEIAGVAGMDDEIGFGDRASGRDAHMAEFIVLEIDRLSRIQASGFCASGVAGAALD